MECETNFAKVVRTRDRLQSELIENLSTFVYRYITKYTQLDEVGFADLKTSEIVHIQKFLLKIAEWDTDTKLKCFYKLEKWTKKHGVDINLLAFKYVNANVCIMTGAYLDIDEPRLEDVLYRVLRRTSKYIYEHLRTSKNGDASEFDVLHKKVQSYTHEEVRTLLPINMIIQYMTKKTVTRNTTQKSDKSATKKSDKSVTKHSTTSKSTHSNTSKKSSKIHLTKSQKKSNLDINIERPVQSDKFQSDKFHLQYIPTEDFDDEDWNNEYYKSDKSDEDEVKQVVIQKGKK